MTPRWWENDPAAAAALVAGLSQLNSRPNGDSGEEYGRYSRALNHFAAGYSFARDQSSARDERDDREAPHIQMFMGQAAEIPRDAQELSAALHILRDLVHRMLQGPHERLAVYGSLRKGESNHRYIADLGDATAGSVTGSVVYRDSYPVLSWQPDGDVIPVEVYASPRLTPEKWAVLDEFEGAEYRRIFIPVRDTISGEHIIATIYADARG